MTECACCGKRFKPDENYHTICPECGEEYTPDWSNEDLMLAVRGLHRVAYGELPQEALEFLAGSAAWSEAVKIVMAEMPFIQWNKLLKKVMSNPPEG